MIPSGLLLDRTGVRTYLKCIRRGLARFHFRKCWFHDYWQHRGGAIIHVGVERDLMHEARIASIRVCPRMDLRVMNVGPERTARQQLGIKGRKRIRFGIRLKASSNNDGV